jgi:hypothetical protein
MDDYPIHLAPKFENGAVEEPFHVWWSRVRAEFPTVPENVAQYWLHEHWNHSPYRYLASRDYFFRLEKWVAAELWDIRSGMCKFDPKNVYCAEHGAGLATLIKGPFVYATAIYMRTHGDFPAPIVVLDNRDGHLCADRVSEPWKALPLGFVLMEGHRRFNLGLHLQKVGGLQPFVSVWLMSRRSTAAL